MVEPRSGHWLVFLGILGIWGLAFGCGDNIEPEYSELEYPNLDGPSLAATDIPCEKPIEAVSCDPLDPSACADGQKCASVVIEEAPFTLATVCVCDGAKDTGEACEIGEPAGLMSGYDDCRTGNECIFGQCRPVCRQQGAAVAGTCGDGFVCQSFGGLFSDLESDDYGICAGVCDPTAGITLMAGQPVVDYSDECGELQCYMNLFEGIGLCAGEFEGRPGHGESCGSQCGLNGCARGNGPFLPGGNLTLWREQTVFFANTIFGLADTCIQYCDTSLWTAEPGQGTAADFRANCPAQHQCRYVSGLYINFNTPDFAPDHFGLCLSLEDDWGSCHEHDIEDIAAYLTDEGGEPIPVLPDNKFIPGCSTGQETLDKLNEISMSGAPAPAATARGPSAADTAYQIERSEVGPLLRQTPLTTD